MRSTRHRPVWARVLTIALVPALMSAGGAAALRTHTTTSSAASPAAARRVGKCVGRRAGRA